MVPDVVIAAPVMVTVPLIWFWLDLGSQRCSGSHLQVRIVDGLVLSNALPEEENPHHP